jgi:hypothetical protein
MKTTLARMRQLIGNAAEWAANDLVIGAGEIAVESQPDQTATLRIGDGTKRYSELPTIGFGFATIVYGNGAADTSAAIAAANAAGKPIYFEGISKAVAPTTITVPIENGPEDQIFTPDSVVTIDNGEPIYPDWFGPAAGNIRLAVNALPAAGGPVAFTNKRYPPSYNTFTPAMGADGSGVPGMDYMAQDNVTFIGAGMPETALDLNSLIDGTGTIINGPFYWHCSNFQCRDLGVDSGLAICAALYGGAAKDGFASVQLNRAVPVFWSGGYFDRIMGLCAAPSSLFHAVLIEAGNALSIGSLYGRRGVHGVVIKSQNYRAQLLDGWDCDQNSVILKSDTYAPNNFGQVDQINGGRSSDAAVRIQAATSTMGGIEIGSIITRDAPIGVVMDGASVMSTVNINSINTHGCAKSFRRWVETRGCSIGSLTASNATTTAFEDGTASADFYFTIGKMHCLNCATGVTTNSVVIIDRYLSQNTSGFDFNYQGDAARILVGSVRRFNVGQPAMVNNRPALAGAWANFAGQSSFDVVLEGYGVRLKGLLAASVGTITTLPPQMRPVQHLHQPNMGLDGAGVAVPILLRVDAVTGVLSVANQPASVTSGVNVEGFFIPGVYTP